MITLNNTNLNRRLVFDPEHNTILQINEANHLVGVLMFKDCGDLVFRVSMVVTRFHRLGYGLDLYLAALAIVSSMEGTLSPDSETVSDSSSKIWEKFFNLDSINHQALDTSKQNEEYNFELFESLHTTNPNVSDEIMGEYSELDHAGLVDKLDKGELQPHLYNFGFNLTKKDAISICSNITEEDIFERYKKDIDSLWSENFS